MVMSETGAFELPSELVLLRDNLKKFMREEVCPAEEKLEHDAYKMPVDLWNLFKGRQKTNLAYGA